MNKARRNAIATLCRDMETMGIMGKLEDLKREIDRHRDDEQNYYDNMPESLQSGDKGDAATEAVTYLETAIEKLDEMLEAWEEISGALGDASA